MAMFRSRGGRFVTTRPSMTMSPEEGISIPAIIRRRVVFPQPDGPSRTRNSPSVVESSTWSTARTSPNSFVIAWISTRPMVAAAFRVFMECAPGSGGMEPPPGSRSELRFPADESLLAPVGENALDQELGLLHGRLGLHPPGGVRQHVREDEGREHLPFRRVRGPRVPHVRAPLLRVLENGQFPLFLPGEGERVVREP